MKYLSILLFISLSACSALEVVHDPLRCIDRPIKPLSERLNEHGITEITNLSDKTFNGLEAHIIAHQKRIESQCELIKRHNEQHERN